MQGAKLPFLQVGGVVAHGRVKKGEFLLVVTEMRSSVCRFDHSYEEVGGWGGKKGMIWKKLVPENPNKAHKNKLGEISRGQA